MRSFNHDCHAGAKKGANGKPARLGFRVQGYGAWALILADQTASGPEHNDDLNGKVPDSQDMFFGSYGLLLVWLPMQG